MIKTTVEVEVPITVDDLVKELKLLGPLNALWVFKALSDAMDGQDLIKLLEFMGGETKQQFVDMVTLFSERVVRAAEAAERAAEDEEDA